MKTLRQLFIPLLILFFISSCEWAKDQEKLYEEANAKNNTTPSGGACKDTYKGPTGDIQSDSFCKLAWNYRCQGKNQEADQSCKVYKQMQADNPGMPNCPYCP